MDKLFRKRTEKSSRNGGRKDKAGVTSPKASSSGLSKFRPRPANTNLPPSLDVDIRNSLIMPSLTERFSVLLPGLSSAPETSIRDLLAQQRNRTDGPSLTVEEEEMLFAELRGNAPSQMSFSQMTNISEWDGNPPPFDNDWGSLRAGGSMAGSVSSPSMSMAYSPSDSHLSAQLSPRSPSQQPLQYSPGQSSYYTSLSASPTKSASSLVSSPSVMERARALPGRSHGFSSNASFRDNNYLAKIAKEKEEHQSPPATRRKLAGQYTSPTSSTSGTPIAGTSPVARNASLNRSDLRGTHSPSSERTVTPTAAVPPGTTPGGSPLTPVAASPATLIRQPSNLSSTTLERKSSNPTNLDRQTSNQSFNTINRQRSNISNNSASPLERKVSNGDNGSTAPNMPLIRTTSNDSDGAAARPSPTTETRTVPLRDEPGKLRAKPVGGVPQQRQSLLVGLSPAQAKRISMALLEIESHLGKQGSEDAPAGESFVVLNEDEEILEDEETEDDRDEEDLADDEKDHHGDKEDSADRTAVLDRQPSTTSNNSTVDASPSFPFPLSPPPTNTATLPVPTTPATKPPSLPASPRTHDLQAMQASQSNGSPQAYPDSPARQRTVSAATSSSSRQVTSPNRNLDSTYDPRDSSATQYSETDYSVPALKPFRPQPVRHTPSPALTTGASSNGSIPGYIPGQPRPVGSRSGPMSPSSSTTSPQTPFSPQPPLWAMPSSATMANIPKPSSGVQLARSKSAQASSNNGSRSNTPTQGITHIDHVPAPGVLAARHQVSQSVSDMGTWRSTSSVSHSPKSSKYSPVSVKHSPRSIKHSQRSVHSQHSQQSSMSSVISPIARVTPAGDKVESQHGQVQSYHSRSMSSPVTPTTAESSPVTDKSRLPSARINHRPSTDSLASSTCSTSFDTDEHSPWDALIRQESPDHATILTPPTDDQDRADLDLLMSMSGIGKEELALIQERLVEKAKSERDRLRTEREGSQPLSQPEVVPPSSRPGHKSTPSKDWPVMEAVTGLRSAEEQKQISELQPAVETSPVILTAPARLDGSDVTAQFPQFPTHTVPRSELPTGPPPARPQPPPSTAIPAEIISPGPTSASSAPEPTARSPTNGRRLDDDPEARRDIEERIAAATTNLFRAPSRIAHKRSLSKKQIGSPVLVSSSSKVPTTPITALEPAPGTNTKKEKERPGIGPRKLSGRWKKAFGRKNHSAEGVPPPVPTVRAATATRVPGAAAQTTSPATHRPTTPVAAYSNSTTPKASQTPVMPPTAHPQTSLPSQYSREPVRADITKYRFPAGPTSPESAAANGRSRSPTRSPSRTSPVALRTSPRKAGASPTRSPVYAGASESDAETALERNMSKMSASLALQHITDSTPPDEGDHIRHIPTESDASIQRFYEAGRAVGLDDNRLSELLEQSKPLSPTTMSSSVRSIPEVSETEMYSPTGYSHAYQNHGGHSRNHSYSRMGRASPIAEDIVTFGGAPLESDDLDPTILRRTIIRPSSTVSSPPMSPVREKRIAPSPLATQMSPPTSPVTNMPKRGNSIRRKPIQYSGSDLDLVERSPKMSIHQRTESATSEAYSLPPRKFGESSAMPATRTSTGDVYDSQPNSAASRSSMGGIPNSSTNGSFLDYYADDRGSRALEITEYADGRVVWNIVNALRSTDDHGDDESGAEGSRASMASIRSQSSNYTGSRRDSERMEDHTAGAGTQQPWHVGPTAGLSFIRRPETRVFYTNSADVADLIDQLSMDHAGATRGRIDIRPTGPGYYDMGSPTSPSAPSAPTDFSAQGHGYVPAPPQKYRSGSSHGHGSAHSHSYSQSGGSSSLAPGLGHGQAIPGPGFPTQAAHLHSGRTPAESQSPSAASFLSDTSAERTVEDRLQALMDRLRSAPGGIGRH